MSYSPPKYPASIPDQVTDLPDRTDDIDWIEAWIYNYVKKELIAVMTELGTDPAGSYATVKAWLTALDEAGVDDSVILNIYLNSFRIAVLGSYSVLNMAGGISDEYEDETGIDTTTSTNEDYDSSNDLYSPSTSYGSDIITGGTASADSERSPNNLAAKACDDDAETYWYTEDADTMPHWWKYDLGEGNSATVTKITLKSVINGNGVALKDFTLQGSNNDSDWDILLTDAHLDNTDVQTYEFSNSKAYRYYKINITTSHSTSYPNNAIISEVAMYESSVIDNMTLVSEKFTADEAPDEARIIIFQEDIDTITLNTDIKAYVSRDDGANYTQITLTDEGYFDGTKRILSGTADISEQASDTDMVYKIETLNNKNQKILGTALLWA